MYNIAVLSILSFFAAFGLIELIRFIYSEWVLKNINYYTMITVKNKQEEIESYVRNITFKTEGCSIVVVDMGSTDNTLEILDKLKQRYSNLSVYTYNQYLDFLTEKG